MLSGVLWPSMVKGSVYLEKIAMSKKKKKKKKKKRKEPMELRSAHQRGSGDLALGLLVFPTGM
jgi:hypothetical protein